MENLTLSDLGGGFLAVFGAIGFLLVWLDGRQARRRQAHGEAPRATNRTMWGAGAILPGDALPGASRTTQHDFEAGL